MRETGNTFPSKLIRNASGSSLRRVAAIAGTVAALAGCTVGPDYTRPEIPLPSHFANAGAARELPFRASPSLDQWWNGFHDPVLINIVRHAVSQNLDIQAAEARVRQSQAMAREAGTDYLPQGLLNADLESQQQSLLSPEGKIASQFPDYTRDQTVRQIDVGATWELDLAGGLRRRARAYLDEAQAAQAAHFGVRVSVSAEAADAYFQIRGANTCIALLKTQIGVDRQILLLVGEQVTQGIATNRDEADAQVTLAADSADLAEYRNASTVQSDRLDVLMGDAAGTHRFHLATLDDESWMTPGIPADIHPAELLRRRPDVIAAERHLAAATENIGVAVSQYYPSISLAGLFGFERLGAGGLVVNAAFQPMMLTGIHWRLFDFGKVDAEIAAAHGKREEVLFTYRQAVLRATEDVEDALSTLAKVDIQRRQRQRVADADAQSWRSIDQSLQAGASSMVDVLKRKRDLLMAKRAVAINRSDRARSTVGVFRTLGGGWPSDQVQTAMPHVASRSPAKASP